MNDENKYNWISLTEELLKLDGKTWKRSVSKGKGKEKIDMKNEERLGKSEEKLPYEKIW